MFASKHVSQHLVRGAVGFAALTAAILLAREPGLLLTAGSVGLVLVALLALRGCPVCWTIGLVETVLKARPFSRRLDG